jgi:hypothetical protein
MTTWSLRLPLLLIASAALFCSCGTGLAPGASALNANGAQQSLQVVQFYPASGSLASPPSAIQVIFNSSTLDANSDAFAANLTNKYWINCGVNNLAPTAVAYSAGSNTVSVSLPPITGLAAGATCNFYVSGSIRDANGNQLTGAPVATYQIGGSGSSGWVENSVITLTAAAGGSGGTAFQDSSTSGVVLTGLMIQTATYLDGVVGQFQVAFNTSSSTSNGQPHGTTSAINAQLSCPAGYAVTGLIGRADTYVEAIGLVCKNQDQSQTSQTPITGGAGGNAFSISCPSGQFATDLKGSAGTLIDQIQLGCR